MSETRAITVRQLNFYAKSLLEGDRNLKNVTVEGEISGFVLNSRSGHAYFTLKDEFCQVKTVMFASAFSTLSFMPENGMKVTVRGRVSLYERDGQFQLYALKMTESGIGDCYAEFLRLKEKLDKEGLFSPEYKKQLPRYPQNIGLITSPTGAALQDFINVTKKRFPSTVLTVYPASVQGENTVDDVISGLDWFDKHPVDLIVITRGGGNYEDLAVFNDERLARRVFLERIPVVSAIGHEIDFTVLDFVADLRAPTPSAAAETVTPDIYAERNNVSSLKKRIENGIKNMLERRKSELSAAESGIDISKRLESESQRLDGLFTRINTAGNNSVRSEKIKLSGLAEKINALNPLSVLSRGFAVALKDEKPLRSVSEVKAGDRLSVKLKDGVIDCAAEKIRENI